MVVSEKPRCGSTKGAATNPISVNVSAMKGSLDVHRLTAFTRGPPRREAHRDG